MRNLDIDGIYLDGAPYERSILRRLRRALAAEGRGSGARPLATCYDAGARPLHLLAGEWPGATPILTMALLTMAQASCSTCMPRVLATRTCPTSSSIPTSTRSGSASSASNARHANITSHTVAASAAYGCSPNHLRLQPPPPMVAGTLATHRTNGWPRFRGFPLVCLGRSSAPTPTRRRG